VLPGSRSFFLPSRFLPDGLPLHGPRFGREFFYLGFCGILILGGISSGARFFFSKLVFFFFPWTIFCRTFVPLDLSEGVSSVFLLPLLGWRPLIS